MATASSTLARRFPVTVLAVILLIIILHATKILSPLERLLLIGLRPLGLRLTELSTLPASDSPSRIQALKERIAALSVENVTLRSALRAAEETTSQEEALRQRRLSGVSSRVFARSPDVTSKYVVVGLGGKENIRVGTPAVIHDAIVVGRVTDIQHGNATVLLTVDNRSSFAAVISDLPLAEGVVRGLRGLALTMSLIPQSEEISPGLIAITSGIDPLVPPGLVLGEVERVDKRQGELFQSATIRPLYSESRLDTITILTAPDR